MKNGALTIPAKIRRVYGFEPGEAVTIEPTPDGSLLISPQKQVCGLCEKELANDHLRNGIPVGPNCIREIEALAAARRRGRGRK